MRRLARFGVELGLLMAETDVTYRELSLRTGLNPGTLVRYASGQRHPDDGTLELIARALGREREELQEWRRRRVLELVAADDRLVDALWERLPQ